MATRRSGYSRVVMVLKIGLPLIALAMVTAIFLTSRPTNVNDPRPRGLDVARLLAQQGIGGSEMVTTTEDGSTITVRTTRIQPDADNPDIARATGIEAEIARPGAGIVRLTAPAGMMDSEADRVEFSGGVDVRSTDLHLTTDLLTTTTALDVIEAPGRVNAETSFGQLTAGSMRAERDDAAGGEYRMEFQGGVKVIYVRPE